MFFSQSLRVYDLFRTQVSAVFVPNLQTQWACDSASSSSKRDLFSPILVSYRPPS
jgi:hypothetical protein